MEKTHQKNDTYDLRVNDNSIEGMYVKVSTNTLTSAGSIAALSILW